MTDPTSNQSSARPSPSGRASSRPPQSPGRPQGEGPRGDGPGARRPTVTLVAAGLIGPVLAVAGALVVAGRRAELPDPIAVHWGASGVADGFMDVGTATVTAALVTALVPLLLIGTGFFLHPTARAQMAGFGAGMAAFLAVVLFGSLLAQAGQTPPGGQVATGPLVLVGMLAGALLGLVLWLCGRVPAAALTGRPADLPADAPRLNVSPTTRLAWTGTAPMPAWSVVGLLAVAVLPTVWLAVVGERWLLLLPLAVGALVLTVLTARVVVDARGLRVTSFGLAWSKVPLERVESAQVGAVQALRDFGGWGWRVDRDGRRGFITRSGAALVVRRAGEPDLVVTVDGPDEAAAVLNTLAARATPAG